ncbi:MAG: TetR/AcrR family transcriptional regulator [Oscillospiraceae bacterium]|jgi:AcrR family transcriptional regulator|nr:TetR/AcrR family transcriptional regulator [Oscillospiraceae bacterium]
MKQTIKTAALQIFDEKGFHRSSIREIATRSGCSLPTLYYHYGSKEHLYEAVVFESYRQISEQIADQIPEGIPLRDVWFFSVMQRRLLTDDDRRVFRLAHKAMLGLDSAGSGTEKLLAYERERRQDERRRVLDTFRDPAFARLLLRVADQMLLSALLENDGLEQNDIRRELDLLFDAAERSQLAE